jgi:hypothetical protein
LTVVLEFGVLGRDEARQIAGEFNAPSRADVGRLDAGELFGNPLVADAITAFSEASTIK